MRQKTGAFVGIAVDLELTWSCGGCGRWGPPAIAGLDWAAHDEN